MLELEQLSISFLQETGWQSTTRNISLQIAPGETIALVGESGSGKTITCLSILRLLDERYTRYEGRILLNGVNILQMDSHALQKLRGGTIGYIFQEPMSALNPVMRCGEQLLEAVKLHRKLNGKQAREAVLDLFREVQLPDPERAYRSYPFQLSGGQKQRVMISMALAGNPQYLIADEPTTALDPQVQQSILDLLLHLKKERNLALLFITHDLGILKGFADKTAILYKGELVELIATEELWTNARHPYTRGLLACRPSIDKKLKRLPLLQDLLQGNTSQPEPDNAISSAGEPLLEFHEIHKAYHSGGLWKKNKTQVLENISFNLRKGETLALIGESGSGKTTIGRILSGLLKAEKGTVLLHGEDLDGQLKKKSWRRKIQMVYQDPYSSLNPRLSIGKALAEPMLVYGLAGSEKEAATKVKALLERVSLDPAMADRYPHELSGGQRQRICIARALALEPEIILLDESVAALDVSVQASVLNLLKSLQEELGISYVFITHSLGVVRFLAHRVLLLKSGQVEEYGDADEFFRSPKSNYGKLLLSIGP